MKLWFMLNILFEKGRPVTWCNLSVMDCEKGFKCSKHTEVLNLFYIDDVDFCDVNRWRRPKKCILQANNIDKNIRSTSLSADELHILSNSENIFQNSIENIQEGKLRQDIWIKQDIQIKIPNIQEGSQNLINAIARVGVAFGKIQKKRKWKSGIYTKRLVNDYTFCMTVFIFMKVWNLFKILWKSPKEFNS